MARQSIISRFFRRKSKRPNIIDDFTFTRMEVSMIADHAFQQERVLKPQIANPVLGYKGSTRSLVGDGFEDVEYDLSYILRIEDIESYLRQANAKKLTLFFKEGWHLVGQNATTVNYVKKRLQQIANATNISTEQLVRSTASDLIKLSNCFWLLARDKNKSGGKVVNGKKPIAGIFTIPAETLVVKTTKNGQVFSVKQRMPDGRKRAFSKENVIHFSLYRKNGFSIGTPSAWPVIEDILALRRIEENVEKLIYRDLFPIYHYKVGTETMPARIMPGGWDEVKDVKDEVESMPPEGIYVTPERHDIKVIGHEGRALRIEGYIKHFNNRVLSGLGLSSVDVGVAEGASKASAETMSQGLVDEVKYMQTCFEDMFDNFVIRTLLKESSFKFDVTAPANTVHIKFREIDLAQQIKLENHLAQMFTQHAINHDELRNKIGELPIEDDWWDKSFWKLIAEPKALIAASDEPYSPAAQALAGAVNTAIQPEQLEKAKQEMAANNAAASQSSDRGNREGAGKDRPSNQHGQKLEPITRTSRNHFASIRDSKQKHASVFEVFRSARNDAMQYAAAPSKRDKNMHGALLRSAKEELKLRLSKLTKNSFNSGYESIIDSLPLSLEVISTFNIINNHINDRINIIFSDIEKNKLSLLAPIKAGAVFDQIEWRVTLLIDTEISRAYNFGRLSALRKINVEKVVYTTLSGSECTKCAKMSSKEYDIGDASLLSIPPHHPNCACLISAVSK
tara:strand:- start:28983 stop:31190 length:2208 start_codon:yes stop_codon:yes gene_type:complete